ncbi:zinc metalloproteinase nas-6-like [Orbicella faveolata]|uniref:zinc metalloproteinase nas-6-like n=1 Tax=Orbicella faveolata TaxID=48498 RepID=UPI0009E5F717|nr:zinc metalloproteinase nas-6-like [Orbicella faveolata]
MRFHCVYLTATVIFILLHIILPNAKTVNGNRFVVIEGDMMVDESFVNNTSKIRKRGAILRRFKSHSFYWPGANSDHRRIVRVPYTLDTGFFSSFFGTGKVVKAFKKAVDQFHKRTCIRFEKKTRKDTDYVEIIQGSGCWSQIGRRGGKQQVSLGKGCETRGRAIHELMHSIGFLHEQSRLDRDQHIIVLSENILEG